jgi:hypothetical protein
MMRNAEIRILVRDFAIELLVYGALVLGYFFLVLRFLAKPLKQLFAGHLTWYAFVALLLIVVQGAALEFLTSFLLSRLRLLRLK